MPNSPTRRPLVVAIALAGAAVVGVLAWRGLDGAGPGGPGSASRGPGEPAVVNGRAVGAGACAFLSTDDVSGAAGGASPVELRRTVSPSGSPGCEWAVGAAQSPLYVEFQAGPGAVPGGMAGEPVDGPWAVGYWSADSRSLRVDEGAGQVFQVVVADDDLGRARQVAIDVAVLVAARN